MVLHGPPLLDDDQNTASGLLHPGLPALLLSSSHFAGGRRDGKAGRGHSHGWCQPKALNQDSASSSRASGSASSSSSSRLSSRNPSSSGSFRVSFPRPPGGAAGLGIGVGGGIYAGGGGSAKATALMPYSNAPPEKESSSKGGPKRLLIMMSNTGGGHRASAEAIRDAFQEKYGEEYQVDIVDMWKDHTPWPFNKLPDSYSFLVRHSILWRISYQMTQPKWFHVPYLAFVGVFMRSGMHRAFDKYQPDSVVSVHPLMQHVPLGVLKQRVHSGAMKPINFSTVVTDFTTCHNTWFSTSVTRCFVPTDDCAHLARQNGLVDEQLIQRGLPIRPLFSRGLPNRRAMRRRLGLDPGLPAILLVGGRWKPQCQSWARSWGRQHRWSWSVAATSACLTSSAPRLLPEACPSGPLALSTISMSGWGRAIASSPRQGLVLLLKLLSQACPSFSMATCHVRRRATSLT